MQQNLRKTKTKLAKMIKKNEENRQQLMRAVLKTSKNPKRKTRETTTKNKTTDPVFLNSS